MIKMFLRLRIAAPNGQWGGGRQAVASALRTVAIILALAMLAPVELDGQNRAAGLDDDASPYDMLPFVCPMDPEIRAENPGTCSRCGMKLVLGLPAMSEYPVVLRTRPGAVEAGERVRLEFEVLQPETGERQIEFETVHERLFHLFWVSHDLEVFRHEHPLLEEDGVFRIDTIFDRPGTYRLMGDFYPKGGTPQMVPMTLTTRGFEAPIATLQPDLVPDLAPKTGDNIRVALRTEPSTPVAGLLTLLFFDLNTARGLQKFLGAWAHMLAVKDDLVTMIHGHPSIADGGRLIQMNVIFPEPGMYRTWVQVRRRGRVNTLPFTINVQDLPR